MGYLHARLIGTICRSMNRGAVLVLSANHLHVGTELRSVGGSTTSAPPLGGWVLSIPREKGIWETSGGGTPTALSERSLSPAGPTMGGQVDIQNSAVIHELSLP